MLHARSETQSFNKTARIFPAVDAAGNDERIRRLLGCEAGVRRDALHERVEPEYRLDEGAESKERGIAAFYMRHFMCAHQRGVFFADAVKQSFGHQDDGLEKTVDANAAYVIGERVSRRLFDLHGDAPLFQKFFKPWFIDFVSVADKE